jgi:hypothetical protein
MLWRFSYVSTSKATAQNQSIGNDRISRGPLVERLAIHLYRIDTDQTESAHASTGLWRARLRAPAV